MRLRSGKVVSEIVFSQKEMEVVETLCNMKNRKITPNHYQKFRNENTACDYVKKMVEKSIQTCMNIKLVFN
mgnify:FL=1|tara:strand:- start:316 stop:528 length:213 start_codon:yes stop_codon:yes gene_type:complete